ncbi:hypothetical protein [Gorillibacterium timonense]|uniref:hypothetical protein n=1 Tax=Gorillibacterium timonense TaxID=1689269 RepID=UPI00071D6A59|nr:hypothetical protein [Gorillibacterium timonense]
MSRKWERMVEKNQKTINAKRKKEGLSPVSAKAKEAKEAFKGMNWMLPFFLVLITILNIVMFIRQDAMTRGNWITFAVYILLAVLLLFMNRPTLSIGRSSITSRRFASFQTATAADIEEIQLMKNAVVIRLKTKKKRWVYTKITHWFPIASVSERLREFAEVNHIALADDNQ